MKRDFELLKSLLEYAESHAIPGDQRLRINYLGARGRRAVVLTAARVSGTR